VLIGNAINAWDIQGPSFSRSGCYTCKSNGSLFFQSEASVLIRRQVSGSPAPKARLVRGVWGKITDHRVLVALNEFETIFVQQGQESCLIALARASFPSKCDCCLEAPLQSGARFCHCLFIFAAQTCLQLTYSLDPLNPTFFLFFSTQPTL